MLSKGDIKYIRSLSQKKFRDAEGIFIVEGEKMVEEALNSSFDVKAVYRIEDIGEEAMSRISLLSSPSPILALVKKPSLSDEYFSLSGISLALDSVRDPGNLGTILRISDWFGIENIFCSEDCVELYNPKTIQATMGAIFRKRVIYIDIKKVIPIYLDSDIPVYGTFLDGDNIYNQSLNKENALIVMGSENNGISCDLASKISNRLLIPSYSNNGHTSESLNVAIATAIICAEFRR